MIADEQLQVVQMILYGNIKLIAESVEVSNTYFLHVRSEQWCS
jgi:hypothetical protein